MQFFSPLFISEHRLLNVPSNKLMALHQSYLPKFNHSLSPVKYNSHTRTFQKSRSNQTFQPMSPNKSSSNLAASTLIDY